MKRRFVGKNAVRRFLVLAKRFTVIGGEDHHDLVFAGAIENWLEQTPERRVHRRHLTEVGLLGVSRGEGLGRDVGIVRIVEMNPREELGVSLCVNPRLRGGDRLYDAQWGKRQTGEGIFAEQIEAMFRVTCRRAGMGERPKLSTAAFRPSVEQLRLL